MNESSHVHLRVELHGELRARVPGHLVSEPVVLEAGSTVRDLLRVLGASGETWLVAADGQVLTLEQEVRDGDVIDLFPALEGG